MPPQNSNNSKTPAWALARIRAAKDLQAEELDLGIKYGDVTTEKLQEIPVEVFDLVNLEVLKLFGNQISKIPESIVQLQKLKRLDLTSNCISKFPNVVLRLRTLFILNLADNQIREIPESIGQLTKIVALSLSKNKITVIPKEVVLYREGRRKERKR